MNTKKLDTRLNAHVPRELKLKVQTKALREGSNLSRLVRLWMTEYIIAPPPQGENDGTEDISQGS